MGKRSGRPPVDIILLSLRAIHFTLIVYPWTQLGSHIFEAKTNPFSPTTVFTAVFAGSMLATLLRQRPRRRITHAVVHGLLLAYSGLVWIGWARGVQPGLPGAGWLLATGLTAGGWSTATSVFWLFCWGLLWWRGSRLAAQVVQNDGIACRLELELGMIFWALVLSLAVGTGLPTGPLLPHLFSCLASGLLALAWLQRGQSGSTMWSMTAGLLILLIVAAGTRGLLGWLQAGRDVVRRVVDSAGGAASTGIAGIFRWLFLRRNSPPPAVAGTGNMPAPATDLPVVPRGGWEQTMVKILAGALVGFLAAAIIMLSVLAVIALLRYLSKPVPSSGPYGRHPRAVLKTMRALARLWSYRFRRVYSGLQHATRLALIGIYETWWPQDPRQLYRGLLRWGRMIGVPREPHETAHEYSRRLSQLLSPAPTAVTIIAAATDLYAQSRYGKEQAPAQHAGTWPVVRSSYRRLFQPWFILRIRLLARKHSPRHQAKATAMRSL